MTELCPLMSRLKSGIWPILSLKLAILATLFKISTSNLFCPAFILRLIGKPNQKSVGPKITSLASKEPHKWPYLNSGDIILTHCIVKIVLMFLVIIMLRHCFEWDICCNQTRFARIV